MPIVFKSNGAPTCCGERINYSGYCILCGEQYDIKELQNEIVRRIETKEFLYTLENKGSNVKLTSGALTAPETEKLT